MQPDLSHPLVAAAYALARIAHEKQFRRDGVTPYMTHIDAVMSRAPKDPVSQAVAAMHDLIEDTSLTFPDIELALGESSEWEVKRVVRGVAVLTRDTTETYKAFIERIRDTDEGIWCEIKVADILSNLADSPSHSQIRRYAAALLALTERV